ncbi:hypothetical protein CBR_g30686 [Chara braunii]|uniref:Uncharacterized protein n=1 Tax=Chara braunii TaxID=69332 RepID=A0A388LDD9_CHABU|nr:hypothetical protein CBR_g30686 [Chara braunii]|eukprot:GBG80318.1 hypothetical protein CBR_g30686 [Chara braunii]
MASTSGLQQGAAEWLLTIQEGHRRFQDIVDALFTRRGDRSEADGGAPALIRWLDDMMQSMLDVIWELEEGPAPQLDEFINWRQAHTLMQHCYDIFEEGCDLCAALEAGLPAQSDMCDQMFVAGEGQPPLEEGDIQGGSEEWQLVPASPRLAAPYNRWAKRRISQSVACHR